MATDTYTHPFPREIDTMFFMNRIQERIQFEQKYPMFQLPFQNIQYQLYPDRIVVNTYNHFVREALNTMYNKYQLKMLEESMRVAW